MRDESADGDDSGPTIGTGFLVNYRDSEKHCIMTAGHNIISQEKNRVNRVEIKFPGGNIGLHATGDQCFVSQSYEAFPNEDNDVNDYGLIAVDRKENEGKLGGFAFSTLIPRSNLNTSQVFVYGYPQGGALQGNSSRLADVKPNQLFHDVATSPGVSGAPVWIKHRDGYSTAIGIQCVEQNLFIKHSVYLFADVFEVTMAGAPKTKILRSVPLVLPSMWYAKWLLGLETAG